MRKWWKWLALVLLFLCALEVLYLAAGNWALRSGFLARRLSRKPDRFQVEWTGGRTVWPGVFHLENLRMRGQSERLQTLLLADRCSFRMHLFMLASCRVHFYDVEGQGVILRVRHRREPGKPKPADRFEPPIPGLEQDAPPPPRKGFPSPWTLHFGSAEIKDLREVWIGPYRATGRGRAEGEVTYRLRGAMSASDAALRMEGATIQMGQEVIASDLRIEMGADIRSVVPREHRGRPFLRFVSGHAKAHGYIASLGFLNEAQGDKTPVTFRGRGQLVADVSVARGVLSPGSKIEWAGEELSASSAGIAVEGRGGVSGGAAAAGDPAFSLVARWSDIAVTRTGLSPIALEGPGLSATLAGPRLDLASGGEELTVTLDLPDSKIRDLSVLDGLLPPKAPFTILPGSPALVRGRFVLQGTSAKGGISANGERVGIGLGDQTLRGGFYAEVKVGEGDLLNRSFDISGTKVGFRNAAISDGGGPWSGEAVLSEGRLRTTVPGSLRAKVNLKMTDTRPVVAVFAADHKSVKWFKGFLDVKDVTGRAGVAMDGNDAVIDGVDVQGKGLQMLAHMRLTGKRLDGAFYASLHHLSAAVSIRNGRRDWKLIGARKWYDAQP